MLLVRSHVPLQTRLLGMDEQNIQIAGSSSSRYLARIDHVV
jgi:hypothetical protein